MIGAIIGGWFQDRVGRRWSLATASVIAAAGIAIMFTCFVSDEVLTRRALFLAGKMVQGLGIGMIMSTTQTWSEFALRAKDIGANNHQCLKSYLQSCVAQSSPS